MTLKNLSEKSRGDIANADIFISKNLIDKVRGTSIP